MCVTFVTCEVRVCGLRCRSGSSLYIYRVYLLTQDYVTSTWPSAPYFLMSAFLNALIPLYVCK